MAGIRSSFIVIAFLTACALVKAQAPRKVVVNGSSAIYTSAKPGEALYLAVLALQRDMKKVLGKEAGIRPLTEIREPGIVILNSEKDHLVQALTGWEAHRLYIKSIGGHSQIVLQGADMRGTIYAVYTFSEKVLGVPPLWYFSAWKPQVKKTVTVPAGFSINCSSPSVKYRAWFPNDTDLFAPWRKQSDNNYALWLETALRLKLNTIEWFDNERDYSKPYSISPTTRLINEYGLVNTTHHHSPLNATFAGWEDYWRKTRDTTPPPISLANERYLEEFWRYNVECIVRNKIDMLWVIGFRGNGDHPFWYTFKDAPASMQERGEVISRMMAKQRQIVIDITGDAHTQFRTIFYDELSDLLAMGYIHPPSDTSFIRTYVAARRDHYPNDDIRQLDKSTNVLLGYYFNYQFTSTGSHLAAGEGPWKMEQNYRYVAGKSNRPLAFSVVNAGNIREFLMELSANAEMMWDLQSYNTDTFLKQFCTQYFGKPDAAYVYKAYYNAYWNQRKPDPGGIDRQYIFQDLRYRRAISELANNFNKPYNPNPLTDIPAEQVPGRTYRIVPADNGASNQVDAVINGTTASSKKFLAAAKAADVLYKKNKSIFFDVNLRQPAWYMYYLNESLLLLCKAYKERNTGLVNQSVEALHNAQKALHSTQYGNFSSWYAGDRIFGFKSLFRNLANIQNNRPNVILILADDMGYADIGCYGGEVHTPNIDRLAKEGIRFTRMYTNAWCSPSRASLLTGLYPQQAGMGLLAEPKTRPNGPYQGYLSKNCVTIAEVLKAAGYATAMSGKWHLGDSNVYWPVHRGFDQTFGLISGAANYFDITKTKSPAVRRKMAHNEKLYTPPVNGFYMTDAITDAALNMLDDMKEKNAPFFLYVAYTAPHWPLHALAEDMAKYRGQYNQGWDSLRAQRFRRQQELGIVSTDASLPPRDPNVQAWNSLDEKQRKAMARKMEIYAAQIDRMDQGIGKILDKLNGTGKKENTIVIFLSDNGGCAEGGIWGFDKRNNGLPPGGVDSYMSYGQSWANAGNTPLRYYKKSLLEGGLATPMIISWPAVIDNKRQGKVVQQVAHLADILPTLCQLTGSAYPSTFNGNNIQPLKGQSLAPQIKHGITEKHQPVFWSLEERKAVLLGDYKLEAGADNAPWELYNLSGDRNELNNLAGKEPARVKEMAALWQAWATKVGVFKGRPKNHTE